MQVAHSKQGFLAAFDSPSRMALSSTYLKRLLARGKKWEGGSKLELALFKPGSGAKQQQQQLQQQQQQGAEDASSAVEKLRARLEGAGLPQEHMETIQKELNRLSRMSKQSADYDMLLNYLEFCADLPWNVSSEDKMSLSAAKQQLEQDHCGLDTVKRRIVEYLAVLKMRNDMKVGERSALVPLKTPPLSTGPHSVPDRASGCGQVIAGPVCGRRAGPQVPPHLAGRRARRGRHPRSPPVRWCACLRGTDGGGGLALQHLHRGHAWPHP